MAYPDAPTFRSPDRGSAWLRDGDMVASTQGYTFLTQLQLNLRAALAAGMSGANYSNGVSASDVAIDGNWGRITNRALYAWAQSHGASVGDLATIRNVEATSIVDHRSLAWAAAAVLGVPVDAIQIDPRTAAPGFRVPAPADNPADRVITTFTPGGHGPSPNPVSPGESEPGIPSDDAGNAPEAQPAPPGSGGGGISNTALAVGIGVVVAGAAAAYAARPNENPVALLERIVLFEGPSNRRKSSR